jgi:hypothetical protein
MRAKLDVRKPDYAYEVETGKNQKGSASVDSDDGAANERQSGNLPHNPTGTDFTFDGNTDSAVTLTDIEPLPTYVETSSDSSVTHSIFPEPLINFDTCFRRRSLAMVHGRRLTSELRLVVPYKTTTVLFLYPLPSVANLLSF